MLPNEYQQLAIRTENQDYTGIRTRLSSSIPHVRMLHAAMGMCTEAGEIMDILKKYFFYGKNFDSLHMKEEVGDKLWYCALMCQVLCELLDSGDMESVMQANIAKLAKRYPEKFGEWEALNRNLEEEKKALEEKRNLDGGNTPANNMDRDTSKGWFEQNKENRKRFIKYGEKVEQKKFGTVLSSPQPRYELIPFSTLESLARRMEKGIRVKGVEGAWNALNNQTAALDKQFVINRLSHCIQHCYKAIDKIRNNILVNNEEEIQDLMDGGDSGAILFAGSLLAEHVQKIKPKDETRF